MADGGEMDRVAQCVESLSSYEDAVLLAALKQALEERPSVVQELCDWAIPDRAYASARLLQENRISGTIKSFNQSSGYGFIDCPEVKAAFGNDVFLHYSQVGNFTIGQQVTFAICVNKERKPQAFDLGSAQNGKDLWLQKGGAGAGLYSGPAGAFGKGCMGVASEPSWPAGAFGKGCMGAWLPGSFGASPAKGGWMPGWAAGPEWPLQGLKRKSTSQATSPNWPETSAEMQGVTDRRFEGTIKSFNEAKGFGFILCDEIKQMFGGDVFLHSRQFEGFEVQQPVSFEVFLNKDGKPQAKDLIAIGGVCKVSPATSPNWPKTSAEMEGVTDRRFEGTIKSFNEAKGFGFILCDEIMQLFGGDVFLHSRQFEGFEVQQPISFEVFLNKDGKPQAKDLIAIAGEIPEMAMAKRARLM